MHIPTTHAIHPGRGQSEKVCIQGQVRAGPLEDCEGVWRFGVVGGNPPGASRKTAAASAQNKAASRTAGGLPQEGVGARKEITRKQSSARHFCEVANSGIHRVAASNGRQENRMHNRSAGVWNGRVYQAYRIAVRTWDGLVEFRPRGRKVVDRSHSSMRVNRSHSAGESATGISLYKSSPDVVSGQQRKGQPMEREALHASRLRAGLNLRHFQWWLLWCPGVALAALGFLCRT